MRRAASAMLALAALPGAQPAAAQDPARACEPADMDRVAGWNGIWIAENLQADLNGRELPGAAGFVTGMKLAGFEAPWTDEGWRRFGGALRAANPESALQAGWGFPVMMSAPSPFTVVVAPGETVIASQYREIRYIHTDGRPHTPEDERWGTNWGESIGCWEGDTLVVDTVSVRYAPEFNYFAPPLSEQARYVERIRLTAPDRLESEITITDPGLLAGPWTTHMVYLRHPVLTRLVHEGEMFGNERTLGENGELTIVEPRQTAAPVPDLPDVRLSAAELDRVAGRYRFDGAPLELIAERRGDRLFFKVSPVLTAFMPLLAEAPLRFTGITGGRFRFQADAAGRVTGFEGEAPDGEPFAGKRVSP